MSLSGLVLHWKMGDEKRLDKFLVANLPDFSRARIQGLIRDGFVLVNGHPAKKNGQVLEEDFEIQVQAAPIQPSQIIPEAIPLDIIFENDDVVVINKPAGMVVHPAFGHTHGTLVHAVMAHAPDLEGISGEQRPGVVHRLDKDTSGLILMAKNERTHRLLQDQFRLHQVKKVYLALVDGKPPTPSGRVEAAIARETLHRQKMGVVPDNRGREAVTEYFTLEQFDRHTLIEVHPFTGRTHQIRVHMAFIGCPVAGDRVYGLKKPTLGLERQFLHAFSLMVTLPGESEPRTFEVSLPPDLERVLTGLRKSN
jgi:23S rRNA pseudouridine1911/1915/1917 synthase